jgi:hypothetical protein
MRLPMRFSYIGHCVPCSRNGRKPRRGGNTLSGRVDSLVDSYQLRVLRYPERYAKTEALGVEGPVFQALSNLRIF